MKKSMSSNTYRMHGECGEFHPAAPKSREKISSQVVTIEASEPSAQPSADVHASTDVENDILLEMPMEERSSHVVR